MYAVRPLLIFIVTFYCFLVVLYSCLLFRFSKHTAPRGEAKEQTTTNKQTNKQNIHNAENAPQNTHTHKQHSQNTEQNRETERRAGKERKQFIIVIEIFPPQTEVKK